MRRGSLALSALLVVACASTEEKRPAPEALAPGEEPPGRWYEVRPGDTLWGLSRRHGLTPDEVAEVNGIETTATLVPGQVLFLPDVGVSPAPPPPERVTIVELPTEGGPGSLAWPMAEGVLLRDYSTKGPVPYEGLMIAAPAGTSVLAAADGEVLHVGAEGAYGTMIVVAHAGDLLTLYAHVDAVQVKQGQRVRRGQVLASVGTSGRAESPQLHFQVRSGRTPVDPLTVLPPP